MKGALAWAATTLVESLPQQQTQSTPLPPQPYNITVHNRLTHFSAALLASVITIAAYLRYT